MRVLLFSLASIAAVSMAGPAAAEPLWGINISGGEFRGVEDGRLLPRPDELRRYHDAGFELFRIPFKARQLDIPQARARLQALARECVTLKVPCIFDRHEYKWPPVAEQVQFWTRFAAAMPKSDLIHFDLMNEPKSFNSTAVTNDWDQWAQDSQAIVTGLRTAGVANMIWLEWPQYSAAFRFSLAAAALRRLPSSTIQDPLKRTGLQAHRYFNKDGSGVNDFCYPYTSIATWAAQAKSFRMPLLLGESAFGSDRGIRSTCEVVGRKAIAELRVAPNMYGVTWWGGGKAWNPKYLHFTPAAGNYRYKQMITGR